MSRDRRQRRVALDLYQQSVTDDPRYAPAWAGLGRVHRMPALDSLRALPSFADILRDAETRHRRAIVSFISAEGDRVLGLEYPV